MNRLTCKRYKTLPTDQMPLAKDTREDSFPRASQAVSETVICEPVTKRQRLVTRLKVGPYATNCDIFSRTIDNKCCVYHRTIKVVFESLDCSLRIEQSHSLIEHVSVFLSPSMDTAHGRLLAMVGVISQRCLSYESTIYTCSDVQTVQIM